MRETAFPRWQFSLVSLFLLADALYLPAAPRCLWLALPLAGLAAALVLRFCCRALAGHDLLALGGLGGRLLAGLFALLAAREALRVILRLCTFWNRTAFTALPVAVTFVLLLAAGLRLARAGTVHLSMWALPTLIVVLAPLALSLVLTAPDWSPGVLLPLPAAGELGRTVLSCLTRVFLLAAFPFLLLFGREKPGGAACTGVFFAAAVLGAAAARNLLLLGAHTAARVPYPTYAAAGLVSVGDFFQRAEALIAGCLTLCELARLAVLILVAARGLRTAFAPPAAISKNAEKL